VPLPSLLLFLQLLHQKRELREHHHPNHHHHNLQISGYKLTFQNQF